jgi:NADPH:quinone reductase-like Zn-dependent oxidoreductase
MEAAGQRGGYPLRELAVKNAIRVEEDAMKAIVYTHYGPPDVLEFKDVAKPVPADNEVLIKLCAASVNPFDWHVMRGKPLFVRLFIGGLFAPKHTILGCDIAGRVEAVGKKVKQFLPGDAVFGATFTGGFAEYVGTVEARLAPKPANMSYEQAAAVPIAAITALQGLRDKGQIRAGQKVLIEGASGGVGTFAVQIAKSFGAEVTAVCSTRNMDTARSLGADHVIDYTQEDFTRNGQRYDLILTANANHSVFDYLRALRRGGNFVMAGGGVVQFLQVVILGPLLSLLARKRVYSYIAKIDRKDMDFLGDLLEAGKVVPVIDRRYPLSDAVGAFRYLEEGHAQGKVVLTVEHGNGI